MIEKMKSTQMRMLQIYISFDPKEDLTFEEALERRFRRKETTKA